MAAAGGLTSPLCWPHSPRHCLRRPLAARPACGSVNDWQRHTVGADRNGLWGKYVPIPVTGESEERPFVATDLEAEAVLQIAGWFSFTHSALTILILHRLLQ